MTMADSRVELRVNDNGRFKGGAHAELMTMADSRVELRVNDNGRFKGGAQS